MEYVTYPPLDIEYTIVFFLITKGGIKGGFRKINKINPPSFFFLRKEGLLWRQFFCNRPTIKQDFNTQQQ
jgi:hypothetical protein